VFLKLKKTLKHSLLGNKPKTQKKPKKTKKKNKKNPKATKKKNHWAGFFEKTRVFSNPA
jgi:hypothetical protein